MRRVAFKEALSNKNTLGMKKSTKSGGHLNSILKTPKVLQRCIILGKAYNISQEGDILTQM